MKELLFPKTSNSQNYTKKRGLQLERLKAFFILKKIIILIRIRSSPVLHNQASPR
jgi:hypothetical protein